MAHAEQTVEVAHAQQAAATQDAAQPTAAEEQPWEECLDDVTLPPGGGGRRMLSERGIVEAGRMPVPEYLGQKGRDLRIDLLRGYFVVAMIVDHVRGQSPLYLLTGGNRFYASAAEGFILTSGLVTGLVYRRLIDRGDLGTSLHKLLSRAASLYLLTIGLTLLFLPVSEILYLPWAQGVDLSNPLRLVVSILTLHRTYYLVDVMLLYTVLFVLVPLAFVIMTRGRSWHVLAASWLLWGLFQFFPDYTALPWPIAGNYLFHFSAWQVLFFSGLVMGYHQERIPALGCRATRIALFATGLGTAGLIALYFIIDPPTALMPATIATGTNLLHDLRLWVQDYLFAKVDLRPGRLLASAITFTFLFVMTTHFWRPVRRLVGWLFLPLGQHALYAYTVHVLITGVIAIAIAPLRLAYPGPQWLNAVIQIASVLLIWVLVRWQVLAPTDKTRRLWYASPAALALLVLIGLRWVPYPYHPGLTPPPVEPGATTGARVPNRFGTPLTESAVKPPASRPVAPATPGPAGSAPAGQTTPVAATPTPSYDTTGLIPTTTREPDFQTRLRGYVGPLKGTLQEHTFYSPELDADMPYLIYLPPDYGSAERRYPVLYMLHGRGGHRDEWPAYGLIDTADQEIRTGNIVPLIIVLPQGDKGYWTNHADDGPRWGEYVVRDLVTHIDATYLTLQSPAARAIGGLSMGGWGALHHAFTRPDVFAVAGAHSPSLRPDDGSLPFLGRGEEYAQKDPIRLAATAPGVRRLRIWIDTAQEDPFLERVEMLHQLLMARGVDHVFQVYPGAHDYYYWHEHSVDYLRFYSQVLSRQ